jgi:hypothetical protein
LSTEASASGPEDKDMERITEISTYQRVARNFISWSAPAVVKVWISLAFLFR